MILAGDLDTYSRRLRRDIVCNTVHALNLVRDPGRYPAEDIGWEGIPIRCHEIFCLNGTENNDLLIAELVIWPLV